MATPEEAMTQRSPLSGDDREESSARGRRVVSTVDPASPGLLKDTYSFLYVHPLCSVPSLYAASIFAFQLLIFGLLLSSLIDVRSANNPLRVAVGVSPEMRVAQTCAILITVSHSMDVMVALNNLLRTPDAIVVVDATDMEGAGPRSYPTGKKFKIANVLRLIEGCLGVVASFILVVQSSDITDMFINFAALEFMQNLDNQAVSLAAQGLISNRLQDAAHFVDTLRFSYKDRSDATAAAGRLARVRGLCSWPLRRMRSHPDNTRRTALFLMTVTLFGVWGFVLAEIDDTERQLTSVDVSSMEGMQEMIEQQQAQLNQMMQMMRQMQGSGVE